MTGLIMHRPCFNGDPMDWLYVVLDDDPTGVQTVHDVSVYTGFDGSTIEEAFMTEKDIFFILTNSRSLSSAETEALHRMLLRNINQAAIKTGRRYAIISRSDSTLRGHYPLEMDVITDEMQGLTGESVDAELFVPFFEEGGRITRNGIHYLQNNGVSIPVAETEFAKDKTFSFSSSDLREYIEEKTDGQIAAEDVCVLDSSSQTEDDMTRMLLSASGRRRFIINAAGYDDLVKPVKAYEAALQKGKSIIVRSAASFIKAISHQSDIPFVDGTAISKECRKNGGLIIIGSHVKLTTIQYERLLALDGLESIVFDQHKVLVPDGLKAETLRVAHLADQAIREGRNTVISIRRERIDFGDDKERNLQMSVLISDAITDIVRNLHVRPAFIIAKGGITSSEIGKNGLGVRKAEVLGQIDKGIPVWRIGPESRFPGLLYVIFPGNVGNENTLCNVVRKLII